MVSGGHLTIPPPPPPPLERGGRLDRLIVAWVTIVALTGVVVGLFFSFAEPDSFEGRIGVLALALGWTAIVFVLGARMLLPRRPPEQTQDTHAALVRIEHQLSAERRERLWVLSQREPRQLDARSGEAANSGDADDAVPRGWARISGDVRADVARRSAG